MAQQTTFQFDLQGHRGTRGLAPENTIPAFKKALELGVNTLEMDVVISKDGQVVVSHESFFNPQICLDPDENRIPEDQRKNLYQMDYAEIKKYDCGSLGHPNYPDQEKQVACKPLLRDVLAFAEKFSDENEVEVKYNIELKSHAATDGSFHPTPEVFAEAVLKEVSRINYKHFTLQSFDYRILRYLHRNYPKVTLAALAELGTFSENMLALGFEPKIYSPLYKLLTEAQVQAIKAKGVKVIPWTVNRRKDMLELLQWGVDGIITDYPNKALQFRKH
ncbi:MAG: glycerophosphodiester phosphodiesterase family protein [Leeuwenhoekiella sp.]